MKKFYLLLFVVFGTILCSCGKDDDDISAINNVKLAESSCIRTDDNVIITASVENYTQNMECWLHVGRGSDFYADQFNYIWTGFKMNYDRSKKELSTEIPSDFFSEKPYTLYGHIIVSDFVKHESIVLGEPFILYSPQVP